MDLLSLAIGGGAMVVVVFVVGILIEVLINHRWGTAASPRQDPKLQMHQQAVRSQLGGYGPSSGPQH